MIKVSRTRRTAFLLGLALLVLVGGAIVGITSAFSDSTAHGDDGCVKPQKTVVAEGPVPAGGRWTVVGSLRNNKNRYDNSCEGLLFGMKFSPDGIPAGSWEEARAVPAKGELVAEPPRNLEIYAQDEAGAHGRDFRVFSGYVSRGVSSVRVNLNTGSHLTIRPKSVRPSLRQKYPWLDNVKYFVRFYPTGQHAREVVLSGGRRSSDHVFAEEGYFRG
jgi:hypothetical protein